MFGVVPILGGKIKKGLKKAIKNRRKLRKTMNKIDGDQAPDFAEGTVKRGKERVRHHTSPENLKKIENSGHIKPSRGEPYGVDVETQPFAPLETGLAGPKRQLGAFGEGAYLEFGLPKNFPFKKYPKGTLKRNAGRIITGLNNLPLEELENLEKVVWKKWWQFWK